jgi:ribosomal protein S18 acetylase RimI-like enzyme
MNSSPGDSIVIRDFRAVDYESLISLWKRSQLPYRPMGRDSKARIAREIDRPNAIFLIAEMDGEVIGSVFGTHEGRKGWINRLAVLPAYRKRGIAARLVAEVERRLTEQGIDIIACLIEEWNTVSIEVFENLGYARHRDIFYFSKRKNPDV